MGQGYWLSQCSLCKWLWFSSWVIKCSSRCSKFGNTGVMSHSSWMEWIHGVGWGYPAIQQMAAEIGQFLRYLDSLVLFFFFSFSKFPVLAATVIRLICPSETKQKDQNLGQLNPTFSGPWKGSQYLPEKPRCLGLPLAASNCDHSVGAGRSHNGVASRISDAVLPFRRPVEKRKRSVLKTRRF